MTILTWKFQATHPALTDFKKRQKLHLCTKNFENNFSFPGVFVSNIAMNSFTWYNFPSTTKICHFRRSKILATVPIIEKTCQNCSCFSSILMFSRLLIGKIEMTHFSDFPHSIELSKYYKNMSFSRIENTGHCANRGANCSKIPVFYVFSHCLAIFDWENWNDPLFWFFSFDRALRVLQNYIVTDDQKYCLLCQRWRKLFKTLLRAFLATILISLAHLSMHIRRGALMACTPDLK